VGPARRIGDVATVLFAGFSRTFRKAGGERELLYTAIRPRARIELVAAAFRHEKTMRRQIIHTIVLASTLLLTNQAQAQYRPRYAQLPPYPSQTMPHLQQTLQAGTTGTVTPGFDPYAPNAGVVAPGAGVVAPAPALTVPGPTVPGPALTVPGADAFGPSTICPPSGCPPVQPVVPVVVDLGPRWRIFGEFLYLRAGDAAMTAYAVPVDGPIGGLPFGPLATIDPDREPGYRAGVGWYTSKISEWSGTYTWFESSTTDAVSVDLPVGLRALVVHPGTPAAGVDYMTAYATSDLKMELIDLEYRRICADCWYRAAWVLGGRYAKLDQDFSAQFIGFGINPTREDVVTNIDFNGAGIRIGLEGEFPSQRNGFLVYAKGYSSFLAGEFKSSFRQTNDPPDVLAVFPPVVVVTTSRKDERIVPILDLEVGVGWRSPGERWRFSAGYLFSAWFNVISNEEFIRAVHAGQVSGVDDTLTFDGLVARAELRF